MVLGGLWHGANWTFLIWGALHGMALVAEHGTRDSAVLSRYRSTFAGNVLGWMATFHFVCFAWIFFRSPSIDMASQFLSGIWTDSGAPNTAPWIVFPLISRFIDSRVPDTHDDAIRDDRDFIPFHCLGDPCGDD